jgi:hypothetical protein
VDVKVTTDLHLMPRSRMEELYLHNPIRRHGLVLTKLRDSVTVTFMKHADFE